MFCDTTGTETTMLESGSATLETELKIEEWAPKLKSAPTQVTVFVERTCAGACGKVMERVHQSTIGLCVSNQDSPKTIGWRGVAMRKNVNTSWWNPTWNTNGIVASVTIVGDEQGHQCGRDHTIRICGEEIPAYRRYETEYAHRERERKAQRISLLAKCNSYNNE